MKLQAPFEAITPTVDGDVLGVLCAVDGTAWFTVGDLARLIPHRSPEGIRKAVYRLVEQGVLETTVAGRTMSVRLNRDHLLADALIGVARSRARLIDRLALVAGELVPPPVWVAVFGSGARGEMGTESDIDLVVVAPDQVGDDWADGLAGLEEAGFRSTGNATQVVWYRESDFARMVAADPFGQELRRDAVTVFGDWPGIAP